MSLPNLSPNQFPQFFEAVHGYAPFRWQSRLAAEVIATNKWPAFVSLPTSAGKTALIDIAVFALACEAHLPPSDRRAPLRTFFVIDRRVVADEAFGRSEKIAEALREHSDESHSNSILHIVATRLRHLAGRDGSPLQYALLRGGIALDDDWIRSPLQPTVCVSTVDQVGSRLLFRGYGVSPRQRSIHASMIAHDSLLIVDEAHISQPFCQTVETIRQSANRSERPLIRPLRFVQMTATPTQGGEGFTLRAEEAAEPELAKRISANKPSLLEAVAEAAEERNQSALITRAVSLAETWGKERTRIIGIVVNRVLTARRIFEALDEEIGEKALFIGRIRSLDRDRLWAKWRRRLTSDPKERAPAERTIFIVATQTIEVGADLDFDALISELAPLNSLRQRFGRLNRRGRPIKVKACIIGTKEQIGTRYDDPVYGKTLAPTWKWLQNQLEGKGRAKTVDFAHTNLEARLALTDDRVIKGLSPAPRQVPLLHRSYLDAWSCTAVPLMHDPDVAPFLHGEKPPELEVQIVWRTDLDKSLFESRQEARRDYEQRKNALLGLVELLPPSSREALPVPLPTAVRWLQRLASVELTDTANSRDADSERERLIRP
ncbi:MAG: type I-U CRISPR-associated helicase/endonuclease Cas3 [Chthoniobacter sp.]